MRAGDIKVGDQMLIPWGVGWRAVLAVDSVSTDDGPALCFTLESTSELPFQQFHGPDEWVTAHRSD